MTPAVVKRLAADLLRRAVEDTWSRNEECRCAAWAFLGGRGACALFVLLDISQERALRAIVDAGKKPARIDLFIESFERTHHVTFAATANKLERLLQEEARLQG